MMVFSCHVPGIDDIDFVFMVFWKDEERVSWAVFSKVFDVNLITASSGKDFIFQRTCIIFWFSKAGNERDDRMIRAGFISEKFISECYRFRLVPSSMAEGRLSMSSRRKAILSGFCLSVFRLLPTRVHRHRKDRFHRLLRRWS